MPLYAYQAIPITLDHLDTIEKLAIALILTIRKARNTAEAEHACIVKALKDYLRSLPLEIFGTHTSKAKQLLEESKVRLLKRGEIREYVRQREAMGRPIDKSYDGRFHFYVVAPLDHPAVGRELARRYAEEAQRQQIVAAQLPVRAAMQSRGEIELTSIRRAGA
ncbi:MAG: hypothetical protein K0R66_840 [Gammaproteobacteria bacterium]|jgi:transcriptional regulator of nitric oxide reductase|nr:hypothetical protein [Gammaproteobacteria bacterium]